MFTLLITSVQIYLVCFEFTEAQHSTSKSYLVAESVATVSPSCEDILYSPDTLLGGSGFETVALCACVHMEHQNTISYRVQDSKLDNKILF